MRAFAIDFIRQIIEQTLLMEHIDNNEYFGGENQVRLFSFYEQLLSQEEVNRYVKEYKELIDQQNRTDLVMNGTIVASENPSITNINSSLIIPMNFACAFKIKLVDRYDTLDTIHNLIFKLKGRKVDIAELDNGKLFMVGTIANNVEGTPTTKSGDYIGERDTNFGIGYNVSQLKLYIQSFGITFDEDAYYYMEDSGKLIVVKKVDGVWTKLVDANSYPEIIFPPEHNSFTKYKVSLSFDAIRCDTPKTLNGKETCIISFGGSASLVNSGVVQGNDLTKVSIKKKKIESENGDIVINDTEHWLEPLEMPSNNNADTKINQLLSNKFIAKTHTDSLVVSLEYTFIANKNNSLINQFIKYARYGTMGTSGNNYLDGITPNIIFEIKEYWVEWGNIELETFYAKIVESVDLEATDSDVLTIKVPFQNQGGN